MVEASSPPLDGATVTILRDGDSASLKEALDTIAKSGPKELREIALALAKVVGTTVVKISDKLSAAGQFNPRTNTITLGKEGLNVHTLIHEMTHAGISATLANPSHPLTKKLTKEFNSVREALGSSYGATDVDEFVSEFLSNPKFVQQLATIYSKGTNVPVTAVVRNIIGNWFRKLRGKPTIPLAEAMQITANKKITELNDAIKLALAPAPKYRNAGDLLMASKTGQQVPVMNTLAKAVKDLNPNDNLNKYSKDVSNFMDRLVDLPKDAYKKVTEFLLGAPPLQAVVDMSAEYGDIKGAIKLQESITGLRGALSKAENKVNAAVLRLARYLKANPKKKELFDKVVYDSTTNRVDPTDDIKEYTKFWLIRYVKNPTYNPNKETSPETNPEFKEVRSSHDTLVARDKAVELINKGNPTKKAVPEKNPDPDKADVWRLLQEDWKGLGKEGQNTYIFLREFYKNQFADLRSVLYKRVDDTIVGTDKESRESRAKIKLRIYNELFARNEIRPYFPLTRSGDYWLAYSTSTDYVVTTFDSNNARKRFMKELEGDSDVVKESIKPFANNPDELAGMGKSLNNAPSQSFMGEVLAALDAANVKDKKIKEELTNIFLQALPESSIATSLIGRGNVAGFDRDALGAMQTKSYDLARQIERIKGSENISRAMDELIENNPLSGDDPKKAAYLAELGKRADFAKGSSTRDWAQPYNRMAFMWTIGANVSSALVNTSQIPLFALPMLSGKYGFTKTSAALRDAGKIFAGSGFDRRLSHGVGYGGETSIASGFVAPSMVNYYELDVDGNYKIRDDMQYPKDKKKAAELKRELELLLPLYTTASGQGQLNTSIISDSLGVDESGRTGSVADRLTGVSAIMFHQAEQFNRQITMMAAYKLELAQYGANPTTEQMNKAADAAMYSTQEINGGSTLETGSRLAQKGIGRVALMYKNYGIQMYYTMFKSGKQLLKNIKFSNNTAENIRLRNEAFGQLVGVHLSGLFFAGVQGIPIYGMVTAMADMFFLDDQEDDAETLTQKYLGDLGYKGPLVALTGVDTSTRIALTNLVFRANKFNNDPTPEEEFAYAFGGPAWSVSSQFYKGAKDVIEAENGVQVERGIESMLPAAVRNAYRAAVRVPRDEGLLTRKQSVIMDDLSFGDTAGLFLGFQPNEYATQQQRNSSFKRKQDAIMKERDTILGNINLGNYMGDYELVDKYLDRMDKWNDRHTDYPAITNKVLRRSAKGDMQARNETVNGLRVQPQFRAALDDHNDEYVNVTMNTILSEVERRKNQL